jgi:hypothetical protein
MKSARQCEASTVDPIWAGPVSFLVVGQGVIATRQLQEAISGVLFCDFRAILRNSPANPLRCLAVSKLR